MKYSGYSVAEILRNKADTPARLSYHPFNIQQEKMLMEEGMENQLVGISKEDLYTLAKLHSPEDLI